MDRVVILGLDGASLSLVESFIEEEHLPNLKRILQAGSRGHLRSTIPPITGPAWTSFMTGVNPGKHGVYDWWARKENSYDLVPVDFRHIRYRTMWEILSSLGKNIVALNVPMTYPPPAVRGCIVSGFGTPSEKNVQAYPSEIAADLLKSVPEYKVVIDDLYSSKNPLHLKESLLQMVEARTRAALYLMDSQEWDLFMMSYVATDMVQHRFWHFYDPGHPRHDPSCPAELRNAMRDVYAKVDEGIGRLVEKAGGGTTVFVMSDHGAGALHKFVYFNNWLVKKGYIHFRRNILSRLKKWMFYKGITPSNAFKWMERLGLLKFASRFSRTTQYSLANRLFLSSRDIDWPRTTAFSIGNIGQIYLNVKGREPLGEITGGVEYEALRDRMMEELKAFVDPDTGESVVGEIFRKEEIYKGERFNDAPDILILPSGLRYMGAGFTEFLSNRLIEDAAAFSGSHRMEGILGACGRNIRKNPDTLQASLLDLFPTIMYLLGTGIPEHLDGRVLMELLNTPPDPVRMRKISSVPGFRGEGPLDVYTDEESAEIQKKLKDLGYV